MASEQMGMPAAAPSSEEMAVFDQMRQNISPKEFSDEMLAGASRVDPQAVSEFRQELDGLDMPPEVLDALNDLVDEILANPERYEEIRQKYMGQGVPEDILPEQFDPQFFAALNMAIDQMIGAPAGPQAFAKGGIAELKPIAKAIAGYGRNGDTMLAHITPAEARMLKRRGGSGTTNPKTGLPEFFSLKGIFKKIGNAVKKFVNSTVGRLVTTVALGFFLGPAAASMLSVSSAAGVAAVSGFVGSAGSTLLGGGSLRDALKAGAVGGITAGAGAGIMGGSEAFTAGSYTGPTTVGGQFERFKSAFSPTPLQQAAAAPVPPAGGTAAPLGVQTTGAAPGTAPVPEVPGAFMKPGSGPMGEMSTATGQAAPAASQVAPPIDVTAAESPLAKFPGAAGPEGITERFKDYWSKNISPSGIQQAGAAQAEQAGLNAMEAMKTRLPNATPAMLESAYQTAYKAAMPGVLATYGPMAAVGIGALGAAGGFSPKPAPDTPESKMMRDRLQREEQMMKDNPGMFTPTGMERFGAVYNDKGQIIKWNPWTPESAGAFEQYKSPLRFPMYAPPPPPPLPVGAGMGGAGGRGYAKGGLASLAGGGMPGYADGGDVQAIRDWWAANEGKATQEELDSWLATSGYSAEQINEAVPQFSVTDLNNAIQQAQARQEVIDREARREALRQQNPGQQVIVSGPETAATLRGPSYTPTRVSAVPQSELNAARASLDPETANYLDWYSNQINPITGKRNSEDPQGVNLYSDSNSLRVAQEAIERAKRREAMGTGYQAEWNDPNWRENQARREAEERAYWDRRAAAAARETTVVGPGGGGGGGTTTPPPSAPPPPGPPTFPPTNPPPVAPPPPPPPTIPPPVTPPSPGQIPWNQMPDFQRYVEATQGSPIRPTFSVLGNYVQGPQDPFGAGKRTPIYSQMGAPAAAPGGASSMAQDSSINLPQYMVAPPPAPSQAQTFNPDSWYTGAGTPATSPNRQTSVADMNAGLEKVKNMDQEWWTPGAFTPPTNLTYQPPATPPVTPAGPDQTMHTVAPSNALIPPSYTMESLSPINTTYRNLTDYIAPSVIERAHGGIAALAAGGYPRRTGQIDGPGTATSDSIPAMLSDGEFVMTAKAVRGAGNGSRREGAKKMYALMHRLEKNAARG